MKKWLQIVLGLVLAVALVWWIFRDTNWGELLKALRSMRVSWLLVAVIAVFASFVTRVLRWGYIVRTAKPVPFWNLFSATQIGFLANFTLPARAGEVIRALVLSRSSSLPVPKCLAFVALDRVTDVFGLITVLFVSALTFHPENSAELAAGVLPVWAMKLLDPTLIDQAMRTAALLLVGLVGVFIVIYVKQELVLRISDALFGKISFALAARARELFQHFADGLHVFRSKRDMAKALAFSLLTWGLFAVTYHALLMAFDLPVPWYASFLLLSLVAVVISIPGTPGFVGQFHAAVFAGIFLTAPGTNPDVARAVAIVAHLFNLVPVVLVGLYCLYHDHMGLLELRRESTQIKEQTAE